jgi:hypothetical protein
MAGGMCPHIFGAWCPHFTAGCSEDRRSSKCIHLPAFMIGADDDEAVRELERAREMFQGRHPEKEKAGC